jgi:hypothetical protein
MELTTKLAWALLALIHASPAAVLFKPTVVQRLYGVEPQGTLGVLLTHRGALFLAIVVACLFGVLDPGARRAASAVVAISVVGFLAVYALGGTPAGPLRTVAVVDAVALLPLLWVVVMAWRPHGA